MQYPRVYIQKILNKKVQLIWAGVHRFIQFYCLTIEMTLIYRNHLANCKIQKKFYS